MRTSNTSSRNVPSLDEAERVMRFVVSDALLPIAATVASGTPVAHSLREVLALTIAVVGATEGLYQQLGTANPEQWESLERSAMPFMDEYVVTELAADDGELKRALTRHRRRKLAAKAGALQLVESDRNRRSRWATVTLPADASLPISAEAGEGLADAIHAAEEPLYEHLAAIASPEPLALAGQAVGLLCASEFLLALFPSNKVAAFCVQLASVTATAAHVG